MENTKIFLNRPKVILQAFGVWLPPEKHVFLYRLYMLVVLLTQYSFVLFEIIFIASVLGDLDEVSEASYLLFTQASVCYKVTVFLIHKRNLAELLVFMDSEIFAAQSDEHKRLLSTRARTIRRLCGFFLSSAITTCSLWALIPLLDSVGERVFPFKIWMPIGPESSPNYELGYVFQMVSIYISAFLFIGVDSVALSMIMFGCAQLEIIMDKLQKLQDIPFASLLNKEERTRTLNSNYAIFIECVKHHQAVIRLIQRVEDTYHANIFFQLSATAAIICIIGLRISMVDPYSVQYFSMINYLVTMLSQLFLYCWCGNELTKRSQDLRDQVYHSPWYSQDLKFKRCVWLVMERMKRPIIFKAGHYIPLSRPTFVSILRSSYSYFAVLNQANNK